MRTRPARRARPGRAFIVAPGFDAGTVAVSRALGADRCCRVWPRRPSSRRPRTSGCAFVKVLPGELAGRAAGLARAGGIDLRDMRFMPTGGIARPICASISRIPSVIACGGSWLAPPELIAAADYAGSRAALATAVSIARSVRAQWRSKVCTAAPGSEPHHHRFRFGVDQEPFPPVLATPARLLHAADRHAELRNAVTVDPDDAGLDRRRRAMRERQVARPDARGETVDRVVRVAHGRSADRRTASP